MLPLERDQINELRDRICLLESRIREIDKVLEELKLLQESFKVTAAHAATAYFYTAIIGGGHP